MQDISLPILENTVLKLYLEDFYHFVMELGGDTATIVGDMLKARADSMTINIILNSFGGPLNEVYSCVSSDTVALYARDPYLSSSFLRLFVP